MTHGRKRIRFGASLAIGATGFAAAALIGSGAANAAPSDVTATATAKGSTVVVSFNNSTKGRVYCGVVGLRSGVPAPAFSKGLGASLTGGAPDPFAVSPGTANVSFPGVGQGSYQVEWGCSGGTRSQWWGTPRTSVQGAPATAQPIPVTVGGPQSGQAAPVPAPEAPMPQTVPAPEAAPTPESAPTPTPPIPLPEWTAPYWDGAWQWYSTTFPQAKSQPAPPPSPIG